MDVCFSHCETKYEPFPSLQVISVLGPPETTYYAKRGGYKEQRHHCVGSCLSLIPNTRRSPTQIIRGKSTSTATRASPQVRCMRRSKVPCRHHPSTTPHVCNLETMVHHAQRVYLLSIIANPQRTRSAGRGRSVYLRNSARWPSHPAAAQCPLDASLEESIHPKNQTQTPDMQTPDVPRLNPGNHRPKNAHPYAP